MILKFILNVVKNIFTEETKEPKPQEKKTKSEKTQIKKPTVISPYKVGEYYVVNVCAIYVLSEETVLLTGSAEKLLTETKKLKYRPIVIIEVGKSQIMVIALSTYNKIKRKPIIKFNEKKNCKFISQNCFLPEQKKDDDIFVFSFEKTITRNGRRIKKRRYKFQIPISTLEDLKNIRNAKLKEKTRNICGFRDNYVLLKKCADCNVDYVGALSKELAKYKK